MASASSLGKEASARSAEGRASASTFYTLADKGQVQGVRRGEHLQAQPVKEQVQGVRRGEHLPAQLAKKRFQGVRRRQHLPAARPGFLGHRQRLTKPLLLGYTLNLPTRLKGNRFSDMAIGMRSH